MRAYLFSKKVRERRAQMRLKGLLEIIDKAYLFRENKGDKEVLYRQVKAAVDLYYLKYKIMTRKDINDLRRYAWEAEFQRQSWKHL